MKRLTASRLFIWSRRLFLGGAIISMTVAGALVGPAVYTEAACRPAPPISPDASQDSKLNTFLDYTARHIAYEQEDLARILNEEDPHQFSYTSSIKNYWNAACAVREGTTQGEAPTFKERVSAYKAGAAFTVSMGLKGAYEETAGRGFARLRGEEPTAQDKIHSEMMAAYAQSLHENPWHSFDFDAWIIQLEEAPIENTPRSWERRISLGIEWRTLKAAGRGLKGRPKEAKATQGPYRISVTGLSPSYTEELLKLSYISPAEGASALLVDRKADLGKVLDAIAQREGDFTNIDGSDRIVLSATSKKKPFLRGNSRHLAEIPIQSREDTRYLIGAEVPSLGRLLRHFSDREIQIEAIYGH